MAELKKYLYDGLEYNISTGVQPILVDGFIVESRQAIPEVIWSLEFENISGELKNAIENIIFLDKDNTTIKSPIGPHYYIGKYIDLVDGTVSYYLTYIFEYDYYNGFVNKPLTYVVDGTDHLIESSIRIPISQTASDPIVQVSQVVYIPRKLFYLEDGLKVNHKFYNHFSLKFEFREIAKPLGYTSMFIVGASYANNASYC